MEIWESGRLQLFNNRNIQIASVGSGRGRFRLREAVAHGGSTVLVIQKVIKRNTGKDPYTDVKKD